MASTQNKSASPIADVQVTTPSTEYNGLFRLEKGVLSFTKTSVMVKNIAQVANYPVRPYNSISGQLLFVSIIIMLASGTAISLFGAVATLMLIIFLAISIYGIWERLRPSHYGITLDLTSGGSHFFRHKDAQFINKIYKEFVYALQNNMDYLVNFGTVVHGDYRPIVAENVMSIDGGSTVEHITGNNLLSGTGKQLGNTGSGTNSISVNESVAGSITNNSQSSENNSISATNGSVVGDISGNNQNA